jgi:uncharacterized protein (DUF2249 family)
MTHTFATPLWSLRKNTRSGNAFEVFGDHDPRLLRVEGPHEAKSGWS